MPELGSISILIDGLRKGDDDAVRKIWERFFEPLSLFAKSKLPLRNRRIIDGEDIASCAIHAFQKSVREGKYPSLVNREHIWKFLATIVSRNSIDEIRWQNADKRGGGDCRGESVFNDISDSRGLERLDNGEGSEEGLVDFIDQLDGLLSRLKDELLKQILVARLAGDSIEEIACQVGCSVSSVERKLRIVREFWLTEESN